MRLSSFFLPLAIFATASVLCIVAAFFSVRLIEDATQVGVRSQLDKDGLLWADVDTNGLQVFLIGTAPTEASRFLALSAAGREVDAARVIDQMNVVDSAGLAPPRFSIEILRNDAGLSLIGLIPTETDRESLIADVTRLAGEGAPVSDLLETANFPSPDGWDAALDFGVEALKSLPRSKISIESDRVAVTAMTDSPEGKRKVESALARKAPDSVTLALDLSAPRPVISPFNLRFVIDEEGPRFDACSADTEEARDRILRAAAAANFEGKVDCRIGLGVPSKKWAEAVELSLAALAELGGESVTFTDADISLVAPEGTAQAVFDRVVGELETALPEVFAVDAVLPVKPDASDQGPPEFTAILSPEGSVQLRGRLANEIARQTADSYARARFGSDVVRTAARIDENLPNDWSVRVLAALEVLTKLSNGAVTVTPDSIAVTGNTGVQNAKHEISGLLADKLGGATALDIRVVYQKKLDVTLGLPTPDECEAQISEIIGARKINFEPGSTTLDSGTRSIMDDLADLLKKCGDIPLEISGHTDSQGRESMNQQLSQERAQAVLDALRERRVQTASYTVKGYGEVIPIADNDTEAGREENRRIEFKLIRPEPTEETQTALESAEQQTDEQSGEETADDQN